MDNENIDIDNKATVFRIILDRFNSVHDGTFSLKLTIGSDNSFNKSGVRIRSKNLEIFVRDFSVITEKILPIKIQTSYTFENNEYSFYLPKGFCNNNINSDVYLLIEMLQILEVDDKTNSIGSVKIPIYPRSDVIGNYNVEIGDLFYKYKGMTRISAHDLSGKDIHCGDLLYQSEFSEIREIIENKDLDVINDEIVPEPDPIAKGNSNPKKKLKKIIEVSSSSATNKTNDFKSRDFKKNKNRIIEFGASLIDLLIEKEKLFPPRDENQINNTYNVLAPTNKEEISVFVQSGEHIFGYVQDNTISYVSCSFKDYGDENGDVYDSTHITSRPTTSPYWEEILNVSYDNDQLKTMLVLTVIDHSADEKIVEYFLPIKNLTPFVQHHLKLSKVSTRGYMTSILYVTVIRKFDYYPLTGKDIKFSSFIVKPLIFLFNRHENNDVPLTCFCYLSNDPLKIRNKINDFENNVISVQFPLPSNFDYNSPMKQSMTSFGQVSIPASVNYEVDNFNFPFVFCQQSELETCFSSNSYIVLDFYEIYRFTGANWRSNSPVKRSVIPLDKSLYRELNFPGTPILKIYDVQINTPFGTNSMFRFRKQKNELNQKLIVKLFIMNKNISDSLSPEDISGINFSSLNIKVPKSLLPLLSLKETEHYPRSLSPPPHIQSFKKEVKDRNTKEPFLYKIDPVKEMFSMGNHYIQDDLPIQSGVDSMIDTFIHDSNRFSGADKIHQRKTQSSKKIDNYKESFKKMQLELMNLRKEIIVLRKENGKLGKELKFTQSNQSIQTSKLKYLENLTMNELFNEYDDLKKRFGAQIAVVSDFKTREENLNRSLNTPQSKETSSDMIRDLQSKTNYLKKLEQTIKQRETRIQNLERILNDKDHTFERNMQSYPKLKFNNEDDEDDISQLYNQLQNSENRINCLQNELVNISRKRGAHRQMVKIKELENSHR